MEKTMKNKFLILILLMIGCSSCEEENYIPKPKGYSRIDFPVHEYLRFSEDCPFEFEYGKASHYVYVQGKNNTTCWFNLEYPQLKATVLFSYLDIKKGNISNYIKETRKLALKHLSKADDFEENIVVDKEAKVYGVIYDFKGSTASNMQFYLTDSVNHFVRGALYFEVTPKADSLGPSEQYVEEELKHLIETFTWK